MTTEQKPRHETTVVGFGKSPNGTPMITCEPWFQTKQPFTIYLNDKESQKIRFNAGDNIIVERGNLHSGKDGKAEWHYYWNFIGFAEDPNLFDQPLHRSQAPGASTPPASPARAPQTASSPATAQGTSASSASPAPAQQDAPAKDADLRNDWRDPTRISIERQQALKYAVELWAHCHGETIEAAVSKEDISDMLNWAVAFEAYLATGTAPQQTEVGK